jgi:hypothetical protein
MQTIAFCNSSFSDYGFYLSVGRNQERKYHLMKMTMLMMMMMTTTMVMFHRQGLLLVGEFANQ